MADINLIRKRRVEETPQDRARPFMIGCAISFLVGAFLFAGYEKIILLPREESAQRVILHLQGKSKELDSKLKVVAEVEQDTRKLEAKKRVLNTLLDKKLRPLALLNELNASVPEGVILLMVKEEKDKKQPVESVVISGKSVEASLISTLRDNLMIAEKPPAKQKLFHKVEIERQTPSIDDAVTFSIRAYW